MCGIVGIVGQQASTERLLDGLRRLEYRGYDSTGIATLVNGRIERRRAEGKLSNLVNRLTDAPLPGNTGIGHTRWATHGLPNETNAHPHATERVALVHNGIIENFRELRAELEQAQIRLETETDSEVVVQLISQELEAGQTPQQAVAATLKRLEGAFALAIIFAGRHELMIGARRGSPLVVGYGEGEAYLGSDALTLAPLTRRLTYLREGDWVVIEGDQVTFFDSSDKKVTRDIQTTEVSGAMVGKDGYRHFMLKEIHEQPQMIGDTLHSFLTPATGTITLPPMDLDLATVQRITLVACGTSYYAGMVAKYWIEGLARIPVELDMASEYRYRNPVPPQGGLALFISQSGETADTLAALRHARAHDQKILSIVNVAESSIARESDAVLRTFAGPEIGVASTKAFTTQLTVLACLALVLAEARGSLERAELRRLAEALVEVPAKAAEVLQRADAVTAIAHDLAEARDVLYLGRGTSYPLALEGALKLKEISYIHAEGYPAGEMKHGPIALIDEAVPVIVINPSDPLFDKTASNLQEVATRGGRVVLLTDRQGRDRLAEEVAHCLELPTVDPFVAPILYALPVQLLAYQVAVLKGTDVDQPRNLAKSVTVE